MNKRPLFITNDPYAITPQELIIPKLEMLNLQDGEVLFDLGAGNAESLVAACGMAKVQCIGYEVSPNALADAKENIQNANLSERIKMKDDDLFLADIARADAIILYLSRHMLGPLSLKFDQELRAGTRIVTHQFDLPGWTAKEERQVRLNNGQLENLYSYKKN